MQCTRPSVQYILFNSVPGLKMYLFILVYYVYMFCSMYIVFFSIPSKTTLFVYYVRVLSLALHIINFNYVYIYGIYIMLSIILVRVCVCLTPLHPMVDQHGPHAEVTGESHHCN